MRHLPRLRISSECWRGHPVNFRLFTWEKSNSQGISTVKITPSIARVARAGATIRILLIFQREYYRRTPFELSVNLNKRILEFYQYSFLPDTLGYPRVGIQSYLVGFFIRSELNLPGPPSPRLSNYHSHAEFIRSHAYERSIWTFRTNSYIGVKINFWL